MNDRAGWWKDESMNTLLLAQLDDDYWPSAYAGLLVFFPVCRPENILVTFFSEDIHHVFKKKKKKAFLGYGTNSIWGVMVLFCWIGAIWSISSLTFQPSLQWLGVNSTFYFTIYGPNIVVYILLIFHRTLWKNISQETSTQNNKYHRKMNMNLELESKKEIHFKTIPWTIILWRFLLFCSSYILLILSPADKVIKHKRYSLIFTDVRKRVKI